MSLRLFIVQHMKSTEGCARDFNAKRERKYWRRGLSLSHFTDSKTSMWADRNVCPTLKLHTSAYR